MSKSIYINYFEREEWVTEVEKNRPLMLNEQYDVIETIATLYKIIPRYIICYNGKDIAISFIALTHNKNIKLPIHFFYSPLWISPKLSDTKYCQILTDFLNTLKEDFTNISIKLPHQISDIRPFLWTNFLVENRFTYIKALSTLNYAEDANKNIVKLDKLDFVFREEKLNMEILDLNLQIFKDLGASPNFKINQIKVLINKLAETNYLTCFSCYLDDNLIVSHILLVDTDNRIVYTILKNREKNKTATSVHSILYHRLFLEFKEKGFDYVDLLGADLKKISLFKSRFKADLYAVDILRYSKLGSKLRHMRQQIKRLLIRFFIFFKL